MRDCSALVSATLLLSPAALAGQAPGLDPAARARVDSVFVAYDREDSPGCALTANRSRQLAFQRLP